MKQTRVYRLLQTSLAIIRYDGLSAFLTRLLLWLRGERRYYKALVNVRLLKKVPQEIHDRVLEPNYRILVYRTEPSALELQQQQISAGEWTERPTLSIVTPVYKPPLAIFQELAESIQEQTYEYWEWVVADASPDDVIWNYLQELGITDRRIRAIRIHENEGISVNTNVAVKAASGDYVVMIDHDDVIPPNALFEVASVIREHPDADLIYSDEDKLNQQGRRCEPLFKPDWSPDLMLCANLITHLSVIRRQLFDEIGFLDPATDGAQDWDLFLRISRHTSAIYHIPKILYHWRKTPDSTAESITNKPRAQETQRRVITHHLTQLGLNEPIVQHRSSDPIASVYPVVTWRPAADYMVSIIIPTKDKADLLERCLETLFAKTTYPHYEVIIVDTGSVERATQALYAKYGQQIRRVDYEGETFNFSAACNQGAAIAKGNVLLFLNNDTEMLDDNWLTRMLQWFELEGVGIVGPKLVYPTNRIQHSGVIVGMGGIAGHIFIDHVETIISVFGPAGWYRNLLTVTGACLMIRQSIFAKLNGFDESFKLNYSDVDLCIRTHDLGFRIVYTPHVKLLHHESMTHQRVIPRKDFELAAARFKLYLEHGDPYFNPGLSYRNSLPTFAIEDRDLVHIVHSNLIAALPHKPDIILPDDLN